MAKLYTAADTNPLVVCIWQVERHMICLARSTAARCWGHSCIMFMFSIHLYSTTQHNTTQHNTTQHNMTSFFPNAKRGFPFHFGGLGARLCSPQVAPCCQPFATVRNPLCEGRKALHNGEWVSKVSQVDLRHRSYFGVSGGVVCVTDLCEWPAAPQL